MRGVAVHFRLYSSGTRWGYEKLREKYDQPSDVDNDGARYRYTLDAVGILVANRSLFGCGHLHAVPNRESPLLFGHPHSAHAEKPRGFNDLLAGVEFIFVLLLRRRRRRRSVGSAGIW